MTDQASTFCYRLLSCHSQICRTQGVRNYVIHSIFDVAGNIFAQPPPEKVLMKDNETLKTPLVYLAGTCPPVGRET